MHPISTPRPQFRFVEYGNIIVSFGLVDGNGMLTNAGALLADEPLVRHSRVFCTRWTGACKDDAMDDAEFGGSLLSLVRESEAFIKRHNVTSWKKTANSCIDQPSYSERAVTEALVNALIHRNYLILGSEVHIDIYDDRLEITSPGSMFEGGKLPNDVLTESIPSLRRNPLLADLFQRMHYMERRGSGLRKICQTTMNEDNFEDRFMPKFEERNGFFFVTLWNMNYHATPQVNQQTAGEKSEIENTLHQPIPQVAPQVAPQVESLVAALGDNELTARELMERMGLSDRKNFRLLYLAPSLESGVIERTIPDKPQSRNQKYRRPRK